MSLEKTIKEIREKTGLTQLAIAKKLGVTVQFMSNVECEKARLPKVYFQKVSRVLDLPIKQMIKMRVQDIEKDLIDELC